MRAAFMGRKHTTTQNVLAAVDFGLGFTYVFVGREGSAHDALILSDALERSDGLIVPPCNSITCLNMILNYFTIKLTRIL
jgi:hypothetical protein